jgi:DNA-binding LacI/PurR family transcriptional regulator/signal transduction histidine kinase
MHKRLTVGLLVNELGVRDDLNFGYQSLVWEGIDFEARKRDINLISFLGSEVKHPVEYQRKRNVIYEHVNAKKVDGLIAVTTILGNYVTREELINFLKQYSPLPIVSVGVELDCFPSVTIDNYSIMFELVTHMIKFHNCKELAFIGGTEKNLESQERLKGFLDAHADAGITCDPDLIRYANFADETACAVVNQWLSEKKQFDAIVAANDMMAVGAIRTLELHGIKVPEQVKVTGFDNIELSRFLHIPMTTIMQPLYKMGVESFRLIDRMIHGEQVEPNIRLPAFTVLRESCGCKDIPIEINVSVSDLAVKQNINTDAVLGSLQDIVSRSGVNIDIADFQMLINCFEKNLLEITGNSFEHSLALYLKKRSYDSISICSEFVKLIYRECCDLEHGKKSRAASICFKSMNVIKKAEIQELGSRILKMDKRSQLLQQFMNNLRSADGIEQLLDDLEENLQRIGIAAGYVVLYNNLDYRKGLFILGKDHENRFYKNRQGYLFDSWELIPESLYTVQHQYSFILHSLFYKEESIGYILVELDSKTGFFNNNFTAFLISGITNAFMSQEIMDSKASLEMANEEIIRNTEKLQNAYELLRKNQEQLIASEKIVALGRLTAGISHEINTPLASIGASNRKLISLAVELSNCVDDPSITVDDYRDIITDIMKCTDLTDKSLSQISEFVSCIRAHTRDAKEEKQSFNMLEKIREVELLIGYELRSKKITFTLNTPHTACMLYGQPQKFTQVVTNMLTNAIDAVKNRDQAQIVLSIQKEGAYTILTVKDNGCGIAQQNRTRIFDPLFTTKPFGTATGMGLTVVHNIVTGEFGGTIDFISEDDCGTTFILKFPMNS